MEAGVGAWKSAGLESHEIVRSNQVAHNLGGEQRGGPPSSGITAKRCALLRAGIRWLLDHRGACTSAEMGHLVGHLTFALLFRRESLACLRAVYDWIARDYTVETPLWDSVRRELGIAVGLLVLQRRKLSQPWSDVVVSTDASVSRLVPLESVAAAGG